MRGIGALLLAAAALLAMASGGQTASGPFRDVRKGHWAYQSIEDLRRKGILLGYPDHAGHKRNAAIEGTAQVGPVRPVQRAGAKNTRPLAGAVIVLQREENLKEVARTRTDAKGRFRLSAAPGKYRLVPLPPNPKSRYPVGRPQSIEAIEGQITRVTVEYDSGIR